MFSSIAGVWGSSGQAAYAAANAFLDASSSTGAAAASPGRRSPGARGPAAAWPPTRRRSPRLHRGGLRLMRPESAITALARSVDHGDADAVVADVDWPRLVGMFDTVGLASACSRTSRAAEEPAATPADGGLAGGPRGPSARPPSPRSVREQAAGVLGHAGPDAVATDRAFRDLGFDSLTAVELRNRLRAATGAAARRHAHLRPPDARPPRPAPPRPCSAPAPAERPVAASRRPSTSRSRSSAWPAASPAASPRPRSSGTLVDRRRRHRAVPGRPRLGPRLGSTGPYAGGFLDDAAEFDAAFFGISPREALAMDPQQRLLLETSWEALERAGIDPDALRGTDTGVFVGTNHQDYGALPARRLRRAPRATCAPATPPSVLSGRVAYALGLEGPAVTVDTACSSSLVALHLAGAGAAPRRVRRWRWPAASP